MTMNLFKCLLISAAVVVSASACDCSQYKGDRNIKKVMKEFNNVGIQAAVVKEGEIIYCKSFGLKNIESGEKLENDDVMRIASISKSFTTTSLMQLVEKGQISLDDDVSDLIGFKIRNPYFPDKKITLRMILSHTSSIKDKEDYFTLDHLNPAVNGDCKDSYHQNYGPGEGYDYSNMGMNLAGSILEKVSGARFDVYVKNNVIRPLGLYGGHNVDSLDAERFATIYEPNDGKYVVSEGAYRSRRDDMPGYVMGYSAPIFSPTGGIKISAHDLARYMTMHMNYGELDGVRIISKESAMTMQTPVWTDRKDDVYGLSIVTFIDMIDDPKYNQEDFSKCLKGHTGSAYGLYSIMIFSPIDKWGIVVMTNGASNVYKNDKNMFTKRAVNALYDAFIR